MAGEKICQKPDLFTVGVALAFAVLCIIGIAFTCVGALYLSDCPIDKHIPVFVVVQGVIFLLFAITFLILLASDSFILFFLILGMLTTFWFCWLIIGSAWVFPHYTTYQGQCNHTLYLFAFWTLIVQYIGLSIAILVAIIYCCFFCIMLLACMAVNG
ncbi:transmembrane protein 272 [Bombina bombina]|uniref:transmembrane protein 272 n=1 Tax=Bombina bombina TaxID=8345 RepID=UPI00235AD167|nr:transmembrane protein 272 [Bombina bombina]XP_053544824.1 transmembrane protein 272 [Bombina bombina]